MPVILIHSVINAEYAEAQSTQRKPIKKHASALDSARSLFVSISRLEMVFFRSIHGLPELNAEAC